MPWSELLPVLLQERGSALKAYAYLLTGDNAAAEDLVQDALVRALSRPLGLREPQAAEAYVRKTMVNLVIDGNHRLHRWVHLRPRIATPDSAADPAGMVCDRLDVHAALKTLTPRQRVCATLRFFDDLPVSRIAQRVGCAEGTVKRYLSEASAQMRQAMSPNATGDRHGHR